MIDPTQTRIVEPPATRPRILENPLLARHALDPDALAVIRRLRDRGFTAYLVGGCVRDLFLRRVPKDFDIATSARPRQIKELFRNCRVIGRRFKLAHLHFGPKILEVSTFRRTPIQDDSAGEEEDLLIRQDNEFGTAEQDAKRRDFTVNALFYDPARHRVIDWVGGLEDLDQRCIRTIGEPITRFREDPVRILRAVKFAARLGFEIDPAAWEAMSQVSPDLARSAPPRVVEDLLRMLRSRTALCAFQMLRDLGALAVLLPDVSHWLDRASPEARDVYWRHLEALDALLTARHTEPSTALVLGVLFVHLVETARAEGEDPVGAAERLINPFAAWGRLSRLDRAQTKRICSMQRRFSERRKKMRVSSFLAQETFSDALDLLHVRCLARGGDWEVYTRWRNRALGKEMGPEPQAVSGLAPARPVTPQPVPKSDPARRPTPRTAPPSTQTEGSAREKPEPRRINPDARRRKPTTRVDPKEAMRPMEGRCVVPTQEQRDLAPPARITPERFEGRDEGDEPVWGDW